MSNWQKREEAMHKLGNLETHMIAWEQRNHTEAYRERLIQLIKEAKDAVMNIKVKRRKI